MILATARGGREVRAANITVPQREGSYAEGAVPVTNAAVVGLPAVHAAITQAAQQVAMLQLAVWRGRKVERTQVTGTWQARLFGSPRPNPRQTWLAFWQVAEASMTARRNAFMWFDMADGRVTAMWALHPDQVQVGWHTTAREPRYRVLIADGWLDPTGGAVAREVLVGPDVIHHIRDEVTAGGRLVAPTPIEAHRASLGAGLAQTVWQERFYSRGTGGGLVLSFPLELTEPQAKEAQIMWESTGGVGNAHGTRVVSGGATVTQVGLSQSDAQYVESMLLAIDDAARIFSWPASLLGGGAGMGQRGGPISPEHELTRMVRYHLMPRLTRWETELWGHTALFGPGTRDYPQFDREGLIRADVATQTSADATMVQAGIMLVDEVRAERGLPPLPGGAGQVPQITPVGGAPNTTPPAAPAAAEPDGDDTEDDQPRAARHRVDVHVPAAPDVHVHMPDQRTPIVNVHQPPAAAPVVRVDAPAVTMQVPEQPAPIVNVHVPDQAPPVVNVNVPTPPARSVTIARDAAGRIAGATVEDTDT